MPEGYYRTGAAAKELNISTYHLRKLAESGSIEADYTGRQWRFPESEINRLKREGIPPIPTTAEPEHHNPQPAGRNTNGHRSEELAEEDPEVVESAAAVKVKENRVKNRKLDRDLEETEDWFRERDEREAEREAAQEAAEQEGQERAEAAERRRQWLERWTEHALDAVPYGAPRAIRLDVAEAVRSVLETRDPNEPRVITERLVEGAVARACAGWQREKETEKAIEEACSTLPWDMKYGDEWKHRTRQASREEISRLRDGASYAEKYAAATASLKPLVAEYEHQKRCNEAIEGVWRLLPGGNYDEWEQGKEALREALPALPIGVSQRQIEAACDKALESIRAAIADRKDQEMRADVIKQASWSLPFGISDDTKQEALDAIREAIEELPPGTPRAELEEARDEIVGECKRDHEREKNKQRLIADGLRGIWPYLQKLERDYKFDEGLFTLDRELQQDLRPVLEDELEGDESPEQVAGLVRRLVREELEL